MKEREIHKDTPSTGRGTGRMTPRERLLSALEHEEPDRAPADLGGIVTGIAVTTYDRLKAYLGIHEPTTVLDPKQQLAAPNESVLRALKIDTRYIFPGPRDSWQLSVHEDLDGYHYFDEWGIKLKMPREGGLYFDMEEHPLSNATVDDLESYPWPDPRDPGLTRGLRKRAKRMYESSEFAIVAWASGSIFERSWYLRGFQRFFIDMVRNEEFATALLDKLLEVNEGYLDRYLEEIGEYIHVIQLADDLGHQQGALMPLQLYRRLIKPRQRKLFRFVKERTEAYLFYHTCGSVVQYIPDLIEIGVDILNPVQLSAKGMDAKKLKSEFGEKLSFWGGVNTQQVLPRGTPEEVRGEVIERVEELGKGGGYCINSVHNIQADVPPENVLALFDERIR